MEKHDFYRNLKYGLLAGLASTVILDIISLVIFLIIGESFPDFFALLGRSFMTLLNIEAAFPLWQGLVLHYSIGLLTGLVLALVTPQIGSLRFNTYRKGILICFIVTQVLGGILFYAMSLILSIPQPDMILTYILGFVLHSIWGTCIGLVISYSQHRRVSLPVYPAVT
jgi:hypothetical protein